ncbi:MAG: LysM peptidoglycan-binding domain-containing protein [Actinomycetales bacterium]|nr:LysM peptidoglycan-binding domain-containing protein [Actinomycetales bacterium]
MTTHARRTLRAATAAVLLLAAVAGAPLLLAVIAPVGLPSTVPTWDTITQALVRPDDGALLIGALRLAAWACWATFTLTTLVDLTSRLRHVKTPALPMLGWLQRTSAGLLTTAGLLLTTTHATATPATAEIAATQVLDSSAGDHEPPSPTALRSQTGTVAITAGIGAMTAPDHSMTGLDTSRDQPVVAMTGHGQAMTAAAHLVPSGRPATGPVNTTDDGDQLPVVVVQRGDSLWRLAERHLGDGTRFEEIADLNRGLIQPDGRTLTDEHWIYPGWRLRLPTEATHIAAAPERTAGTATYTVKPGDTLWDIAATQLGDGDRYHDIVDLNHGITQPDGAALDDPDLIRPGWTLTLPGADPSTTTVEPAADPPEDAHATGPVGESPTRSMVPDLTAESGGSTQTAPAKRGPATLPPTARASAPTPDRATQTADAADADRDGFPGPLLAGLSLLAAAGVTGEIARRRHLRHRRRRTGERLPMPAPGSPEAETERTLRRAAPPLRIAQLRGALARLAADARAADIDQPPLAVLQIARDTVTVHLTDPVDPPAPWTATNATIWTADVNDLAALQPPEDPDAPEPYPALVTVGHTTEAVVLVNLEATGTFTVTGPDDLTAPVLRAIVAELVTSDLTGRIGLATGPTYAPLAAVCDTARLHVTQGRPSADHAGRDQQIQSALAEAGADNTLQARSDRTADDTWLPVVYVATPDDPAPTAPADPWSGSVLLTADAEPGPGWSLDVTDLATATLRPLGLVLAPQHLDDAQLTTLIAALDAAGPATTGSSAHRQGPVPEQEDEPAAVPYAAALAALPAPRTTVHATTPPRTSESGDPDPNRPLRIKILGPVEVTGAAAEGPLGDKQVELLVYLAIHGKATAHQLDDALWPGRRVDRLTRNSFIYRTRSHVGRAQFPVMEHDHYALADHVHTDWDDFTQLAQRGLEAGADGIDDLHAALALIRDRPFIGIDPRTYTWADTLIQEITTAIADVAHCLAAKLADTGDHPGAAWAAAVGLLVEPASDQLHQDALDAALARHNTIEARRLAKRREALLAEIDPDAR